MTSCKCLDPRAVFKLLCQARRHGHVESVYRMHCQDKADEEQRAVVNFERNYHLRSYIFITFMFKYVQEIQALFGASLDGYVCLCTLDSFKNAVYYAVCS